MHINHTINKQYNVQETNSCCVSGDVAGCGYWLKEAETVMAADHRHLM